MSSTAAHLAERARKTDNFPMWLPMLAPLGVALIAGYMVVAVALDSTETAPEEATAPPQTAELSTEDSLGTFGADPLTVALGSFRYMLTGDRSSLPATALAEELQVIHSWEESAVDLSIVDYSRDENVARVSMTATGPGGSSEFVRLQLEKRGEGWFVSEW